MNQPEKLLQQYFGHASFRTGQKQAIDAILSGRDVLAVMPTGAGKSVCYQISALLLRGVTIVISPLISLMKDQVEALRQVGIPAAYVNSSITQEEFYHTVQMVQQGQCRILYVAPERLMTDSFFRLTQHDCRSRGSSQKGKETEAAHTGRSRFRFDPAVSADAALRHLLFVQFDLKQRTAPENTVRGNSENGLVPDTAFRPRKGAAHWQVPV